MEPWLIGVIVFLFMMFIVFMGVPVFVSMMLSAFIGFVALYGGDMGMALTQFTSAPFNLGANYNYAVLPMFMLLGALAGETGIAEGAFESMKKFFNRVTGGLLYTVIGANAVFGACSGSSVAGNIVFGKLALPELEKAGYDRKYSLGCIAASGALSTLIPPSMAIIMFCLIIPSPLVYMGETVNVSVGSALMGGIGPGIVAAFALCMTVKFISVTKPGTIPKGSDEIIPLKEKLQSLKLLVPIIALFALIIGGTFNGWFTATVAGAIGAMATCIYAVFKKTPMKVIARCVWEAAVMEAGIFLIIIGGQLFGRFVADTYLADMLSQFIISINAPAFVVYLLVMLLYILCGCMMDIVSVIIITVPIVFPILCNLGYSPYVLVIALCFMTEIAGLTPPVGMNVFATANALKISPSEIFKGVVPYFCTELAIVVLIGIFPQIVTFIPSLMGVPGF
ncbi:MAG: TRAP transporter large permease [Lachnospirales bacterium]